MNPATAELGCDKCPFKDLGRQTPESMKVLLKQNYATNRMDCHHMFPKWKPGLCHKGDRICAGYACRANLMEEPDYTIPRFEDEFPIIAEVIRRLCAWHEYKKLPYWDFPVSGIIVCRRVPEQFKVQKPGRNQPCGCHGGRKFKDCCQPLLQWFPSE